jgi:arginine exporter protein ArgO
VSLNEAELLKIKEQHRGQIYAVSLQASAAYSAQHSAERSKALDAAKDYGISTVRLLTLLNGGAILSLMTFIGGIAAKATLSLSGEP